VANETPPSAVADWLGISQSTPATLPTTEAPSTESSYSSSSPYYNLPLPESDTSNSYYDSSEYEKATEALTQSSSSKQALDSLQAATTAGSWNKGRNYGFASTWENIKAAGGYVGSMAADKFLDNQELADKLAEYAAGRANLAADLSPEVNDFAQLFGETEDGEIDYSDIKWDKFDDYALGATGAALPALVALFASLATGGSVGALMASFRGLVSQSVKQAVKKGAQRAAFGGSLVGMETGFIASEVADPETGKVNSDDYGTILKYGTLAGAASTFSADKFLKLFKPNFSSGVKGALKTQLAKVGVAAGAELPTESFQEAMSILAGKEVRGEELSLNKDDWHRVVNAGLLAMAGVGTVGGSFAGAKLAAKGTIEGTKRAGEKVGDYLGLREGQKAADNIAGAIGENPNITQPDADFVVTPEGDAAPVERPSESKNVADFLGVGAEAEVEPDADFGEQGSSAAAASVAERAGMDNLARGFRSGRRTDDPDEQGPQVVEMNVELKPDETGTTQVMDENTGKSITMSGKAAKAYTRLREATPLFARDLLSTREAVDNAVNIVENRGGPSLEQQERARNILKKADDPNANPQDVAWARSIVRAYKEGGAGDRYQQAIRDRARAIVAETEKLISEGKEVSIEQAQAYDEAAWYLQEESKVQGELNKDMADTIPRPAYINESENIADPQGAIDAEYDGSLTVNEREDGLIVPSSQDVKEPAIIGRNPIRENAYGKSQVSVREYDRPFQSSTGDKGKAQARAQVRRLTLPNDKGYRNPTDARLRNQYNPDTHIFEVRAVDKNGTLLPRNTSPRNKNVWGHVVTATPITDTAGLDRNLSGLTDTVLAALQRALELGQDYAKGKNKEKNAKSRLVMEFKTNQRITVGKKDGTNFATEDRAKAYLTNLQNKAAKENKPFNRKDYVIVSNDGDTFSIETTQPVTRYVYLPSLMWAGASMIRNSHNKEFAIGDNGKGILAALTQGLQGLSGYMEMQGITINETAEFQAHLDQSGDKPIIKIGDKRFTFDDIVQASAAPSREVAETLVEYTPARLEKIQEDRELNDRAFVPAPFEQDNSDAYVESIWKQHVMPKLMAMLEWEGDTKAAKLDERAKAITSNIINTSLKAALDQMVSIPFGRPSPALFEDPLATGDKQSARDKDTARVYDKWARVVHDHLDKRVPQIIREKLTAFADFDVNGATEMRTISQLSDQELWKYYESFHAKDLPIQVVIEEALRELAPTITKQIVLKEPTFKNKKLQVPGGIVPTMQYHLKDKERAALYRFPKELNYSVAQIEAIAAAIRAYYAKLALEAIEVAPVDFQALTSKDQLDASTQRGLDPNEMQRAGDVEVYGYNTWGDNTEAQTQGQWVNPAREAGRERMVGVEQDPNFQGPRRPEVAGPNVRQEGVRPVIEGTASVPGRQQQNPNPRSVPQGRSMQMEDDAYLKDGVVNPRETDDVFYLQKAMDAVAQAQEKRGNAEPIPAETPESIARSEQIFNEDVRHVSANERSVPPLTVPTENLSIRNDTGSVVLYGSEAFTQSGHAGLMHRLVNWANQALDLAGATGGQIVIVDRFGAEQLAKANPDRAADFDKLLRPKFKSTTPFRSIYGSGFPAVIMVNEDFKYITRKGTAHNVLTAPKELSMDILTALSHELGHMVFVNWRGNMAPALLNKMQAEYNAAVPENKMGTYTFEEWTADQFALYVNNVVKTSNEDVKKVPPAWKKLFAQLKKLYDAAATMLKAVLGRTGGVSESYHTFLQKIADEAQIMENARRWYREQVASGVTPEDAAAATKVHLEKAYAKAGIQDPQLKFKDKPRQSRARPETSANEQAQAAAEEARGTQQSWGQRLFETQRDSFLPFDAANRAKAEAFVRGVFGGDPRANATLTYWKKKLDELIKSEVSRLRRLPGGAAIAAALWERPGDVATGKSTARIAERIYYNKFLKKIDVLQRRKNESAEQHQQRLRQIRDELASGNPVSEEALKVQRTIREFGTWMAERQRANRIKSAERQRRKGQGVPNDVVVNDETILRILEDYTLPHNWNAAALITEAGKARFFELLDMYEKQDFMRQNKTASEADWEAFKSHMFNRIVNSEGILQANYADNLVFNNARSRALRNIPTFELLGANGKVPLIDNQLDAALRNYFHDGARTIAWEEYFGGYEQNKDNGQWRWNANEQIHDWINGLREIDRAEGTQYASEAEQVIDVLQGRSNRKLNTKLRMATNVATALLNMLLLPFAVFASFPDIAGIAMRADGDYSALLDNIKQSAKAAWGKDPDGLLELAETMGIVTEHTIQHAFLDEGMSQFDNYHGGKYQKVMEWQEKFFSVIQLQAWTNFTRVLAMQVGRQYLDNQYAAIKTNERYGFETATGEAKLAREAFAELGITPEEWAAIKTHRRENDGSSFPEYLRDLEAKVMNKFVDESVMRPSAELKPGWQSDPRWATVAHLKSYFWYMQETYWPRLWSQLSKSMGPDATKSQKQAMAMTMLAGMTMLPLAILGLAARDLLYYAFSDAEPPDRDILDMVGRTGALGIYTIPMEFVDTGAERGFGPELVARNMGPLYGYTWGALTQKPRTTLSKSVPGVSYFRGGRDWIKGSNAGTDPIKSGRT